MGRQTEQQLVSSLWGRAKQLSVLAPFVTGTNPDGTDYSLPITTAQGRALERQRMFFAGSGRMSLAVAGNLRATIQNPTGSGRNIFLAMMRGLATGTGWADMFINPTTGLPTTTPRPNNNAVVGSTVGSVAVIRVDTNATTALSGGTATGLTLGIAGNSRFELALAPFVIPPGVTLGINDAFAGAADVALSLYWWEFDA